MDIGERIAVRAYKADGTCYRRWSATVEAVGENQVVTVSPFGHRLEGVAGTWCCHQAIRTFYWSDRWYNVLEVYGHDGELEEIYVNVSSPAEILDVQIRFTDYELDVSWSPGREPRILDQDEFAEAASRYGYSQPFQEACYRIARKAVKVARHWVPSGMPVVGTEEGNGE